VSEENEAFLDRWSRLKQEQAKPPVEEKKEEPAPALPPVEELKPDSDFKPFMDPRIDGETRRAALKKLFDDAHFKTIDPFEPYSVDLTGEDPIPPEMLKTLNHARRLIFDEKDPAKKEAGEQVAEQASGQANESPPPETKDVAGKQDA
jgi:hypothetical protein